MARFDDRFDGYNAAPLNQSVLDRGLRAGAGTLTGALGGGLLGMVATPVVAGIAGAALVATAGFGAVALLGLTGSILGVGSVVGAVASSAGLVGGASLLAGIGAGVAGVFGAPLGGLIGGLVGGMKGGAAEHARANLDQSLYNINVAEAMGRGAAQAQMQQAFSPVPAQPVVTQPTMRDAVSGADVAPLRRDDYAPVSDSVLPGEKPLAQTEAGSPIQHDGTINAQQALARL